MTSFVYHGNAEFARGAGAAEENFCNFFARAFARPALRADFFGSVFVGFVFGDIFFNLGVGMASAAIFLAVVFLALWIF